MTAITFRDFSYAYPGRDKILDSVNLTVPHGSFTVVAGPNGAGKTSLCLAIGGIVPHYFGGSLAGEVLVAGVRTLESSMGELAAAVGTVLEDYESQLVTMTVAEEVAFALESRGLDHGTIRQRVTEALGWVGLAGLEQREISSLSGGQRQRLAIAAVLATKAAILVLDEPASALDPEGAEEIYALLAALNREHAITVVVVEHDLARVLPYVDQLVVLVAGKIVRTGGCGEVLTYLWQQEELKDMVPPLWAAKFGLEHHLDTSFGDWRRVSDAVDELAEGLAGQDEEETKSA
ncbi:MAG: ABC transporter ATP-binding protein [Negativicutes bacterium]|nr:ABC transporter ATP-binding protein [Negativicutes bacterium]